MKMIDTINERYKQLQAGNGKNPLTAVEQEAITRFREEGVPTTRHEEWKYTRISNYFQKDYAFGNAAGIEQRDLDAIKLPGHDEANIIVFVNGIFNATLSTVRSSALTLLPLAEAAAGGYGDIVTKHLGHSSHYIRDGILALNTAFAQEGIFLHVQKGKAVDKPVYIYHISDARSEGIYAQPRSLVYVSEAAQVLLTETQVTLGISDSFTNGVIEIVLEQDALVDYYKIQNDGVHTASVSTTHFRQVGKSVLNAVTISLDGGTIRNNLNIAMEAAFSEANLYGLYFIKGKTHVDNHTIVDNVQPNCYSNELYKGIIDESATAVFNGKIFVQQIAQKTNAFQSNKNILLSDNATVNTKPQLEIFADDVKCSHGCTIGQLDEESLFYLRSRGISEKAAQSLLVHAFAIDILEHIRLEPLRVYVDDLISKRLDFVA